jgi:hypothetical protein
MSSGFVKILFSFILIVVFSHSAHAQSGYDTIRVGATITEEGDTVLMVWLDEFTKTDKLPRKYARQRESWDKLRYNVYRVYPYACIAADLLKDVDANLAKFDKNNDKEGRKKYMKNLEKQLNSRFKGELENLSIGQGQILVKLIDRQTGHNCYGLIRELKGGFSAVIWQSVALLFSNNLKREYDPLDRDKDIETIVKEIETRQYYQRMYQSQAQAKK